MLRCRLSLALATAAAALLVAGCQFDFVVIVSNQTDAPMTVSFRFGPPGSAQCQRPERDAHMPASHVGRWFREPERSEAWDVAFDPELCSVQATVPAQTVYLESVSNARVFTYAARPPNEVRDRARQELRARRAPPATP